MENDTDDFKPLPPWQVARPSGHPGILLKKNMDDNDLSIEDLAGRLNVPEHMIRDVVIGTRSVHPELCLKLSRFFNHDISYWSNRQRDYDLYIVFARVGIDIHHKIKPLVTA